MPSHSLKLSSNRWVWALLVGVVVAIILRTGSQRPKELNQATCPDSPWKSRLLSYDPLIAHIEDFLTPPERAHLLALQKASNSRSQVLHNGTWSVFPDRSSSSTFLNRSDPTVGCIMKRAAETQGFMSLAEIEDPQITHYTEGQQFKPHFDWTPDKDGIVHRREATIFAIIDANCSNCGTTFPLLEIDWAQKDPTWCNFFDCNNSTLTTRPVPGSAIFWRNTLSDGTGDRRTLHAGLPLRDGFKAGLNIWLNSS